jgi:hypothetical protein
MNRQGKYRMRRGLLTSLMVLLACSAAPAHAASSGAIPAITYDSVAGFLKLPENLYLGEAAGVASNSKGHVFVYTRTGSPFIAVGAARPFMRGGSRLFEFDAQGKYVREIGQGIYGFMVAHAVRIDAQDNIWAVDEGSNVIMKFSSEGRLLMALGRKPEAIAIPTSTAKEGPGVGVPGDTFDGPTDIAWDAQGNIFVADGSGNARIVKLDRDGAYIRAWGGRGSGAGQFNDIHTLAVDARGNVYVGDRGNSRIQVFDNDGKFKTQIQGVGVPTAICISPGSHPYLYSSNSSGASDFDNGEIYRMELDGRILGKFGAAGKRLKEFGSVHEIDCRGENTLLVGELSNWRVQKLVLNAH